MLLFCLFFPDILKYIRNISFLNISFISRRCYNLNPVINILHKFQPVTFCHIFKDRTLDSAPVSYCSLLFSCNTLSCFSLNTDINSLRLASITVFTICMFCNILPCDKAFAIDINHNRIICIICLSCIICVYIFTTLICIHV